jgi:hypothetical protein
MRLLLFCGERGLMLVSALLAIANTLENYPCTKNCGQVLN